jgi:TRAP transporter TAXI family solute receptor
MSLSLLRFAPFLALAAVVAPGSGLAQDVVKVILGTATPGGGFPAFGDAFVPTINENEPTLRIEPVNTKGSLENLPRLEQGTLDIALVAGEPAYEAIAGIGRAPTTAKIIAAIYSSPGMFVVRADSPYRTIADLKGKPIAWGVKTSGLVILGRYVMDGLGLDLERDFQANYLEKAGDGPLMVQDGRVAALWGGGIGWPGFMAMAKSPAGARFIVPDAGEIARISARHNFLKQTPVPANSYPGQTVTLQSVASWSFVMARPTLPDDVAYKIIRAVHRGEAAITARLAQARETTAANTALAAPRADTLHPGVARYLREAGLLK